MAQQLRDIAWRALPPSRDGLVHVFWRFFKMNRLIDGHFLKGGVPGVSMGVLLSGGARELGAGMLSSRRGTISVRHPQTLGDDVLQQMS